jgi:hypothetical protein
MVVVTVMAALCRHRGGCGGRGLQRRRWVVAVRRWGWLRRAGVACRGGAAAGDQRREEREPGPCSGCEQRSWSFPVCAGPRERWARAYIYKRRVPRWRSAWAMPWNVGWITSARASRDRSRPNVKHQLEGQYQASPGTRQTGHKQHTHVPTDLTLLFLSTVRKLELGSGSFHEMEAASSREASRV